MSGALRSGLIFAAAGLVGVLALSFVPLVGALCCGPLAAGLIGTAAGYYGVRWSGLGASIGRGALAAALAGVGALIGGVIFWMISFSIVQANPELYQQILRQYMQQQQTQPSIDPQQLAATMRVIGPITALCFGVFDLLLALAFGVLGGWLAARNQNRVVPPAASPPLPPPMAPPA